MERQGEYFFRDGYENRKSHVQSFDGTGKRIVEKIQGEFPFLFPLLCRGHYPHFSRTISVWIKTKVLQND